MVREQAPPSKLASTAHWLIGIDDTDNVDSRGTGYRARQLVAALEAADIATGLGVTRHQLLVDDRVPYTSHNSCACLEVDSAVSGADLAAFCRDHLIEHAADGADVGLCLAPAAAGGGATAFGRRAKTELMVREEAHALAASLEFALEGLTGTRDGVIGALAGIGLFADGNDGRYIWKRRLRELTGQTVTLSSLTGLTGIDDVVDETLTSVLPGGGDVRVALGDWPRPVRIDGRSVLLVRRKVYSETADTPLERGQRFYECIEKSRVKALRP